MSKLQSPDVKSGVSRELPGAEQEDRRRIDWVWLFFYTLGSLPTLRTPAPRREAGSCVAIHQCPNRTAIKRNVFGQRSLAAVHSPSVDRINRA
jgi:hypothetical protein